MSEKLLVFGGRSFIARVMAAHAHSFEYSATLVYRTKGGLIVEGDDKALLAKDWRHAEHLISDVGYHPYAINCIAATRKDDSVDALHELVEANVNAVGITASVSRSLGVKRFLHYGTFSSYTDGVSHSPQTLYAASKLAGIDMLRHYSRDFPDGIVVLEPYDIYSADHPHGKLISQVLDALATGKTLHLSKGEQELAPIHALDVARASMKALKLSISSNFQLWSLPGPSTFTLRELVHRVAQSLNAVDQLENVQFDMPYRQNEMMKVQPFNSEFALDSKLEIEQGIHIRALRPFV